MSRYNISCNTYSYSSWYELLGIILYNLCLYVLYHSIQISCPWQTFGLLLVQIFSLLSIVKLRLFLVTTTFCFWYIFNLYALYSIQSSWAATIPCSWYIFVVFVIYTEHIYCEFILIPLDVSNALLYWGFSRWVTVVSQTTALPPWPKHLDRHPRAKARSRSS